ncbi:MAG: hypothetical protein MI725_10010 [Pirellulales bacterium]|nr:hypothetical protein [Pirellulales bacterium]
MKLSGWQRLALAGWSAATSGLGLWFIFSLGNDEYLSAFAAAGLTILLQALILRFWDDAFLTPVVRLRYVSAVFALIFATISALLASGAYTVLFNKAALEEFLTDQEISGVEIPVVAHQGSLERAAGELQLLAAVATRKAGIEDATGGSCQGSQPIVGKGPIWRMRNRHAADAATHALALRNLSDDYSGLVLRMRGAASEADLLTGYNRARRLAADPRLLFARDWANELKTGFQTGFVDPDTGRQFSCTDPDVLAAAENVVSALDIPGFPERPPTIVEFTYREALNKSYGDAFRLVGSVLPGNDLSEQEWEAVSYSFIGFGAAAIVELAIMFLTWTNATFLRRSGQLASAIGAYRRSGRELGEDEIRTVNNFVRGLGPLDPILNEALELVYSVGNDRFLLVPIDGSPGVRNRARRIALLLGLQCLDRSLVNWSIAKLDPDFVNSRSSVLAEVTKVDLYPVSSDFEEEIAQLARDSAFSGGPPTVDDPEDDRDARSNLHVHQGGRGGAKSGGQ